MKKSVLFLLLTLSVIGLNAQNSDSLLLGKWNLFKIIDNLTGDEIIPPKPNENFVFYLSFFEDSLVKFNLEINKCENNYVITGLREIKFIYYAECTKICCDKEFSSLLVYEDCTNYYIKNRNTLILVSEDRMYYFRRDE